MASRISWLASGMPRTRLNPTASTRYSALRTRTSWPLLISGTRTRRYCRRIWPRSGGSGVAQVGREALLLGTERHVDVGQRLDVRDQPGLGAVREIPVGEDHDRHHVLDRDAHRFVGDVEAVTGRARRDDDDGALAVAPV